MFKLAKKMIMKGSWGSPVFSEKATLAVEVSGFCNLACQICSHPRMNRKKGFMEWRLFEKVMKDASENGHSIGSVHFFGEPLMWPHIVDGAKLMACHGFLPRVSTNGMLLTRQLARQLQDAGMREIMVTIDTLRPEVYSKIRRGGDLSVVKRNIHDALAAAPGLLIGAQLMPTKYNLDETEEDFYREFGRFNNFRVVPWFVVRMNRGEDVSRELSHSPDEVDKRLCSKPFDRVDVLWDGTTVLCCLDSEGELVTGNLNENSISYSWLGPKAMALRRRILEGDWFYFGACSQCAGDHIVMEEKKFWRRTDPPGPLTSNYKKRLDRIRRLDRFDEKTGKWTVRE